MQPGEIRVDKDGEENYMAVSGGFLEVLANRVTILADTAERAEEIDIERAEAAVRRAEERIASRTSDMDLQRAVFSLRRSQARVLAARRRRRPRRGDGAAPPQQPGVLASIYGMEKIRGGYYSRPLLSSCQSCTLV